MAKQATKLQTKHAARMILPRSLQKECVGVEKQVAEIVQFFLVSHIQLQSKIANEL